MKINFRKISASSKFFPYNQLISLWSPIEHHCAELECIWFLDILLQYYVGGSVDSYVDEVLEIMGHSNVTRPSYITWLFFASTLVTTIGKIVDFPQADF